MAAKVTRWTPEVLERQAALILTVGRAEAAKRTGISEAAQRLAFRDRGLPYPGGPKPHVVPEPPRPEIQAPPSPELPIDELVESRIRRFALKEAHEEARRLIPVRVREDRPIGILLFGDPHVDDDGCDLALLKEHAELVRDTPGLYGANVGDTTNNWIGRLAHLYGQQSASAAEAWRLAEWFVGLVGDKWLYMVGGNHDCHDTETEALTRRGWLGHDALRDDDEVLSFVPETGACEWAPILRRVVREHDGELLDVETRSISLSVTPNHRVLCKDRDWKRDWREWGFVAADSLPPRVALPVSGQREGAGVTLSDDQIALAGWILTDGCIYRDRGHPRVAIYQSKDGARIQGVLDRLGVEHSRSVRDRSPTEVCGRALVKPALPETRWQLSNSASREVVSWLPSKEVLPEWAGELDARQFGVLLDALIAGDGCWDGARPEDKHVAVLHGRKTFLDSVQAVAVQHGWYARLSVAREKDWRLNLCRRDTIQFDTKPATTRRPYKGLVWCLTVPRGNFMVRRRGAAHFSGNCWSGAGDPLKWIAGQVGAFYQDSEVRIALRFPNKREVRINCRHDFAGRSQWNPAHGPMKALFLGVRDHLAVAGHQHESAFGVLKDPDSGITMNAVKVASYKTFDRYAREKNFRDQTLSPCALVVIDPLLANDHPDLVKVFWDPHEGAAHLGWKRSRKRAA